MYRVQKNPGKESHYWWFTYVLLGTKFWKFQGEFYPIRERQIRDEIQEIWLRYSRTIQICFSWKVKFLDNKIENQDTCRKNELSWRVPYHVFFRFQKYWKLNKKYRSEPDFNVFWQSQKHMFLHNLWVCRKSLFSHTRFYFSWIPRGLSFKTHYSELTSVKSLVFLNSLQNHVPDHVPPDTWIHLDNDHKCPFDYR